MTTQIEAIEAANEAIDPILQFFRYDHLQAALAVRSKPFYELAHRIAAEYPRNAERTVALRKLLEAKDAAVRSVLFRSVEQAH